MPAPERACLSTGCLTARGPRATATSPGRITLLPPQWRSAVPTGASPSSRLPAFMASASCPSRPRITTFYWWKVAATALRWRPFSPRCATRTCARKSARLACAPRTPDLSPRLAMMFRVLAVCTLLLSVAPHMAQAQLRGHGGPVRALAISPDGTQAVSGSFDTSAIRWSLPKNAAEQVLRFHDGAVNAAAFLADGRIATSGEDARIAIWTPGAPQPSMVLAGHTAPVVALSVSPDGTTLASASWDHTARLWPLAGGAPRVIEGHAQNVNGVAFAPDGRALITAGYNATLRISPLLGGASAHHRGGLVARRQPHRRRRRPRLGRHHRPAGAQTRTHPGRTGTAGLVGRLLPRRPHAAHRRQRPHDPPLGRGDRRADRQRGHGRTRGPAGPLRGGSGRRGVSRLRRLSHVERQGRRSRRPHARRSFRPQDRDASRLQFLRRAQEARYRVDAGDGLETIRGRAYGLYARHQNAGAADRLGRGSRRLGEFSGESDQDAVRTVIPAFISLRGPIREWHRRLRPVLPAADCGRQSGSLDAYKGR